MKTTTKPATVNPLPTVTMPGMNPLIRFLAKADKKSGRPIAEFRYGNRAQAEAKRESLADRLVQEGSSSAIVQVESRFLIAIFPAEYDLDQKTGRLIAKDMNQCDARIGSPSGRRCGRPVVSGTGFCLVHSAGAGVVRHMKNQQYSPRPPFATVSGRRYNPRNRHNQNLPDDGPGPVYCQQSIPQTESKNVRALLAKGTATDRRAAYRAVSNRLNGRGQESR